MNAHIAFISDYGNSYVHRSHNNLAGIPWSPVFEHEFKAERGQPDARGIICNFPSLDVFADAYVFQHEHLLTLSASDFLDHMQHCAVMRPERMRWEAIKNLWRKDFARES